jgi:hypothetical protein
MYLEKTSLNLEDEEELECSWKAENNTYKKFGHGQELCACFIDWQKAFGHRNCVHAS